MGNTTLYEQSSTSGVASVFMFLFGIAIVVFVFVVMWMFYAKAGRRGWESLVPIYNIYALMKIAGRPGWWTILYFIPLVNIVVSVVAALDIAKAFGRSSLFGVVGLFLFSIIGYGMIAFGDDTYRQPNNS